MMKNMIGHKIHRVFLSRDKTIIAFTGKIRGYGGERSDGRVYRCEPDCCNHVWINHMSGVSALQDAVVTDVTYGEWECHKVEECDHRDVQKVTIVTEKGRCDLEFRNDHNGYYGGRVTFEGEMVNLSQLMDESLVITGDF